MKSVKFEKSTTGGESSPLFPFIIAPDDDHHRTPRYHLRAGPEIGCSIFTRFFRAKVGIVRSTTIILHDRHKTGCPILRASCEGWVIERSETVFFPNNLSTSIEANPMITIEPSFDVVLSTSALTRFLNRARLATDLRGEVDILLANDRTLQQLNKTFRGKNKPTDVLSFPAPTAFAKKHAGDLAISLDTAARQARTHGHTLSDEIKILILHGLLHLAGEDHETDQGQMAAREATLRRELRLPATLIERTSESPSKHQRITIKKPHKTTQKSPQKPRRGPK